MSAIVFTRKPANWFHMRRNRLLLTPNELIKTGVRQIEFFGSRKANFTMHLAISP